MDPEPVSDLDLVTDLAKESGLCITAIDHACPMCQEWVDSPVEDRASTTRSERCCSRRRRRTGISWRLASLGNESCKGSPDTSPRVGRVDGLAGNASPGHIVWTSVRGRPRSIGDADPIPVGGPSGPLCCVTSGFGCPTCSLWSATSRSTPSTGSFSAIS